MGIGFITRRSIYCNATIYFYEQLTRTIMSIFSIALRGAALLAFPAAEAFAGTAGVARPLLGLGVMAALLVVFKPLLVGVLRAASLVFSPRKSLEERNARRRVKSALAVNLLAREFEATQPNQAAELRSLASRGY
jgi:hypothetical protein